jgi:hypothetical protein
VSKKYIQRGFWAKKENVLADAQQYRYQAEWAKASGGAFSSAKRNGWLADACSHMTSPKVPMGYWTLERLMENSQQYQTPTDWKKANASAYATASAKGWLEICCAHMTRERMPSGYWTQELVVESALGFSTVAAWILAAGDAYDAAKRNGWIKDATAHMVKIVSHGVHTIYTFLLQHDIFFEYQKRFVDLKDKKQLPLDFYLPTFRLAIEFHGRQHFESSQSSMYRKNLVGQQRRDEIKRSYTKNVGIYYLELDCSNVQEIEAAIISKLTEIADQNGEALKLTKRALTNHEKRILASLGIWTKEAVLVDALKYNCTRDWQACGNAAYQVACTNGWKEEATSHMVQLQKPKGYWTKERVLEDARLFTDVMEWFRASQSAHATAQRNGWLPGATAHMVRRVQTKKSA